MLHTLLGIVTAKKFIPTMWTVGLFVAVIDPTVAAAAVVTALGAVGTVIVVFFNARAAADARRSELEAATDERKAAAAERITNAAERKILLEKAERAEREIAANTALTTQAATILTKVDATTEVISGHVNSAATRADEERKSYEAERDASRLAHDAQVAMFRETIADLKAAAATLASAKATSEAIAAVSAQTAIPAAPGAAPVADAGHLQAIETNTADTAANTAKTDRAVTDALKP